MKSGNAMAIYHLHAKVIQRSKGENVIAASAYRRAAKLRDHKEEKAFDFTAKKDVIYSDLMVPDNAPAWVQALAVLQTENPSEAAEQLWNALEAVEKRKDAQLGREIEFALPIELTQAQSIALAGEFIRDQLVSQGMIADWSVHWDTGNPHVHVLLTMRVLTEAGFGRRAIEWNNKALLQTWREQWAEYANYHLHLHQHNVRIDHRSYEAQGIDLIPGIHQGGGARAKAGRGETMDRVEEANAIRRLNLARLSENSEIFFRQLSTLGDTFTDAQVANLLGRYVDATSSSFSSFSQHQNPIGSDTPKTQTPLEAALENTSALTPDAIQRILNLISTHESVFTEKDISKAVEHFSKDADAFAKIVTAIKQSPQVIASGKGADGPEIFTTRALFEAENTIQQLADNLKDRWHRHIPESQKQAILEKHQTKTGKSLTDEQKTAIDHLLRPHAIACIVGRAGTGKSFCLGAAKALWESQNVSVYGIALSGIAADGLSKDTGLPSTTIASFCYRVENQLLTLKPHDVIIMDEAGMTDSLSMLSVLKIVHQAEAKLVLVGDPAQLQPVGPGASFRALVERLGFAEMQTVYRQSVPWQRQATVDFSGGAIAKGLAAYKAEKCIHVESTPEAAMQQLLKQWQKVCGDNTSHLNQVLVIAHRNADIQALNLLLRADCVKTGKIEAGYLVKTRQGEINLASGDRILFLKNDRELGVSNGRFATVESIDFLSGNKALSFTVKLDGSDQNVTIHPTVYADFTYGYAATVHKTQGMTVDHSLVYLGGKGWNRHLTYVALSRHRQSCQVYADRETHANQGILMRRLSRLGLKDSVLDFPLAFAERRGIDHPSITQKLSTHLAERLAKWKKQLTNKIAQWKSADKTFAREVIGEHESLATEKVDQQQTKKQRESASDKKNEKKSPLNQSAASYQRIDMKRLRAALNDRAEAVATHYLGQPKLKQGHTLRYGSNKGSLVVTIDGAKQELWRDFQLDKGGDMFSLIQQSLETTDFKTLLIEATRFLGGDSLYRLSEPMKKTAVSPIEKPDLDADLQQKIQKAQAIVQKTQPIAGTLAERYLREHRGILQPLNDQIFCYHPNLKNWMKGSVHPALIILARDEKNEICGLQAIFLDPKTGKKAVNLSNHVKLSRGFIREGTLVHQGNPNGKIALAEGPETALSIAEAQPDWTVYVTFGVSNFAKVRLPDTAKSVLICADNDGHDSATAKSVTRAAEKLSQRRMDVWVAEPQKPLDKAKWDFNDVLLTEGIAQVQGDLAQGTLVEKGIVKEHNRHAVEKNWVGFNTGIPASETTSTQTISTSTPDIQNASLQTLLMDYVDRELEQTRLVNVMHSARLKDPEAGKIAASEAIAHANSLEAFAEEALQHSDIQAILEMKQNVKPPQLADCGGFSKLRERLQQGEWLEEDIHLLAVQLRNKAVRQSLANVRKQTQGGRVR